MGTRIHRRGIAHSLEAIRPIIDAGLRLVPLHPRSKIPFRAEPPDQGTGWHVQFLDTVDEVRRWLELLPGSNVAIRWPGVQVDIDSDQALVQAKSWGVRKDQHMWGLRTSRGWRLLYGVLDPCPPTGIDSAHQSPDLLGAGRLAVIQPYIHASGKLYAWIPGRSPADLPITELEAAPRPLLEAWAARRAPRPPGLPEQ